ncbi:hypothetical protein LCA12A_0950 [Lacticaseibacillus casei 12A]|uniref:hypothetical protein n=1 Tax=Lacticaseibacillus paracasei TaxID=1597 RepID=UPI00029834A8|nr:hypothetical protein [Lacticaseibacillus paracasei]EKP98171.1 hypothetical protein LCA12A_0950 [Lacticaseibacillus casei 12A]
MEKKSIAFLMIIVMTTLSLGTIACSNNSGETSADSTSSSKSTTKTQDLKNADQLKLGMSEEQVKKIVGDPSAYDEYSWSYATGFVYFKNGKVSGGTLGSLSSQVMDNASSASSAVQPQSSPTPENSESTQKAFAQSFGQKTVDRLQKMPSAYKSSQLDATTMEYMWNSGHGMMIRLDTADRMTSVYLYDSNADYGKGRLLYSGRTIFTNPKVYNFYN